MTPWRRSFGTDLVETLLWGAGSFIATVMVVEFFHDRMFGFATALGCIIAFGVRRAAALKAAGHGEITSGAYRAADLDARLAELEQLHARVAELEERVDFSERLLAAERQPAQIERT